MIVKKAEQRLIFELKQIDLKIRELATYTRQRVINWHERKFKKKFLKVKLAATRKVSNQALISYAVSLTHKTFRHEPLIRKKRWKPLQVTSSNRITLYLKLISKHVHG